MGFTAFVVLSGGGLRSFDRVQSCANPMLAEFVLGSDIQELVEIFEKRTGEKLLS